MTILLLTLSLFLLYLIYERFTLSRIRRAIPTVICVTGTRGKTSVVRMLASILRERGQRVLAKTTGSQAQYVLPDGTIENVPRRGIASIIEQKRVLRKAAQLNADCLVVEMMSIHPQNHEIESCRILKPDVAILTNIRRDHIEAMGETEEDISRVLSLGISPGARTYLPEELLQLILVANGNQLRADIVGVPRGSSATLVSRRPDLGTMEFVENLDLLAAVSKDLKIDEATIVRGVMNTVHDVGKLKVWIYRAEQKTIYLVNAFAANDPDSTLKALEKARQILGLSSPVVGLLNLRFDRGDRTEQWINSLGHEMREQFSRIYVLGGHARVVSRRVPGAELVKSSTPEKITAQIADGMEDGGVLFGFGNIGGAGKLVVDYWNQVGQEHGS